jgi:hypothetical protein
VRTRSLPALVAELEEEVTRRTPVEVDEPTVEPISVQDHLPSGIIATEEDLEAWLSSLRALIAARLVDGKQVRLC